MNQVAPSTKLNGSLRAYFKSQAKIKFEQAGTSKASPLKKRNADIQDAVMADPDVKPLAARLRRLSARIARLEKDRDEVGRRLRKEYGVSPNGYYGRFFFDSRSKKFGAQYDEYTENERQIKRLEACKCQRGESPEMLEFSAHLSLCKTVGDAETLLKGLNS